MKQDPSLASVLDLSALPASFGVVDTLASQIRYRDLIVETSPQNDGRFYSLTIVTGELAVDLLGSGLKLIFFPADNANAPESEFGVAFEYRWAILRYVPEFETLGFAGTGKAFFDIFLELVDITEVQFLTGIVECLIDDAAPYQALVNKLKQWQGGSSPLAGLTLLNQPVGYSEIEYIVQQVPANVDIFVAAFEAVVEDVSDIEKSIDNVVALFQTWLGDITRDDIEDMLVPQFSIELEQVSMAIEVPRSVLVPLDANDKPIGDVTKHSRLTFTAGGVRYDSRSGFDIEIDQNIAATFTKSIIPGFGLTLEFDDIKIDLSRTTNIAEADAEGRPADFMGVYVGNAVVGLPKKWFDKHQPSSGNPVTLGIVGRDLLFGTGGASATIGLEVLAAGKPKANKDKHSGPEELEFILGKQPPSSGVPRKGFKLGFSSFDMKFRQNVLLESKIKGSMTIPKFQAAPIGIELFIAQDGDFKVTASVAGGHLFEAGTVFSFRAMSLSVEKDDDRVFAEATGDLSFENNPLMAQIISAPIHIEKLRIGSDGSFEIEGGTIPLPESVIIPLGPAKIAITAIHCGAHEQEHGGVMRKYRFWRFSGGINVNPGGFDASGDGFTYYYTVDDDPVLSRPPHHFFGIEGINIKLVIPGTASKETAALILEGYLALKDPVYQGSISFTLPRAQIAGAASMAYDTSIPAWIVKVSLDLPVPLPLAATALGFYGFDGLFGLRYVASKNAAKIQPPLAADASWGDYYRAPPKGVSIDKFVQPPDTNEANNPFSVGVGAGLATINDGGRAFTSQLFLLVSLPNLILLEGRFDIQAEKRVGLDDDPPYYAYLALSPESVELGAGISYRVPKDTGAILNLNAVFEAAFFFHNRSAWYAHFGTKVKPATARVIGMFDGYGYLMLSASGIEAGTGVHYDFNKNYGPVSVAAHAYLDLWAYVSFDRPQAGGGMALGGSVDIKVLGVGFYIELAAGLTVEAATPFRVAGYAEVCVTVNLKVKEFHKCVNLEFVWEHPDSVDVSPIWALPDLSATPDAPAAAIGIHMASGATYAVEFSTIPNSSTPPTVPLDTYIDVKFSKPVNPINPPNAPPLIGGFTNPPSDNIEVIPPKYGSRIVTHSYALESVKLEVWNSTAGWIDYHPFVALAPEALVDTTAGANLADLPIGFWQKQGPGYTQIRFLALTPFNYMEPVGGYRPEEMGLTAQTVFCQGRARSEQCLLWDKPAIYAADTNHYRTGILYRIQGADAAALPLTQAQLAPLSLAIKPGAHAIFLFPKRTVSCRLTLFTSAPQIMIRFQRRKPLPFSVPAPTNGKITVPYAAADFEDVAAPTIIMQNALANPIVYNNPALGIDRVIVETPTPNLRVIADLEETLALRNEDWFRADKEQRVVIEKDLAALTQQFDAEHKKTCVIDDRLNLTQLQSQIRNLSAQLSSLRAEIQHKTSLYDSSCRSLPSPPRTQAATTAARAPPVPSSSAMSQEACHQLAAKIAALQKRVNGLDARIADLQHELLSGHAESRFPPGWQCGTFVHEICWLSEEDWQYNQTIPGISAIEVDFHNMRAAVERIIAPIWEPKRKYRITLKVSDTVTGPSTPASLAQRTFYVHFQTEGPIGHFAKTFDPPDIDTQSNGPQLIVPDDGRAEIPERSLKFYIDMERSRPNPSGNLLYAKPVYYGNVVLQLFLSKPYAYHFFADWPAYPPGNPSYAIELRIKDPAETEQSSGTPDHTDALVLSALTGTQTWVTDTSPRRNEDLKVLNNFQRPRMLAGAAQGTACLATGGAPIIPAAKMLETEIKNLKPDKLYTVVVLNKDLSAAKEAEVLAYPFETSLYSDFQDHITSYKLKDDAGNERLAVFKVSHDLADASGAPPIYDAALKIIMREPTQPTAETAAYPDPFDRLVHASLKLEPLPPATTLEFNFIENALVPETYGLLVRSFEPLNDARIPLPDLLSAIAMYQTGTERTDARFLLSKDCCQAFVMIEGGVFPTTDVSFKFSYLGWDDKTQMYVASETITTESFSSP